MTKSTRQILEEAKALISEQERWGKGEWYRDGCMCIEGALAKASDIEPYEVRNDDPIVELILKSIPEDFAGGFDWRFNTLVNFNDHPDTTHEDVMKLFERAILSCD